MSDSSPRFTLNKYLTKDDPGQCFSKFRPSALESSQELVKNAFQPLPITEPRN